MNGHDAATAALVDPEEDRGDDGVGDQPSPRVRGTGAAQALALAREAFDAGCLQRVRVTLTEVSRIRAKKQSNEGGGGVRHGIRL